MAKLKVLAGDFLEMGDNRIAGNKFTLRTGSGFFSLENIPFSSIETLEMASEESVKKVWGTVGWGAVGAVTLGPLGLLAGVLVGGRKNEATFVALFKDGRKVMATTTKKHFTRMQAEIFDNA